MPQSRTTGSVSRVSRILRYVPNVLALLALAAVPLVSDRPSRAYEVQTVEVSEAGFNPGVCRMNREYVQFKNVGSTPRRVIRPGIIAGDPPLFDTGVIQPGETSNAFIIPYGGSTVFYDAEDSSHFVTVVTPVFVQYWEPICTPDPNYQPPQPPCRTNPYCLRLPLVGTD